MIPSWLVIAVVTFIVPFGLNRLISSRDFRWFKRLRRPEWLTFEWAIPIIWMTIFIWELSVMELDNSEYGRMVCAGFTRSV